MRGLVSLTAGSDGVGLGAGLPVSEIGTRRAARSARPCSAWESRCAASTSATWASTCPCSRTGPATSVSPTGARPSLMSSRRPRAGSTPLPPGRERSGCPSGSRSSASTKPRPRHTNHAGGLRLFEEAGAEIVVHEEEYRHVMTMEQDRADFFSRVDWAFLGAKKPTLATGGPPLEILARHARGHREGARRLAVPRARRDRDPAPRRPRAATHDRLLGRPRLRLTERERHDHW